MEIIVFFDKAFFRLAVWFFINYNEENRKFSTAFWLFCRMGEAV